MASAASATRAGPGSIARCQFAGLTASMASACIPTCVCARRVGRERSAILESALYASTANAQALNTVSASMGMRGTAVISLRAIPRASMDTPQEPTAAPAMQDGPAGSVTRRYARMSVVSTATACSRTSVSVTRPGTRVMSPPNVTPSTS